MLRAIDELVSRSPGNDHSPIRRKLGISKRAVIPGTFENRPSLITRPAWSHAIRVCLPNGLCCRFDCGLDRVVPFACLAADDGDANSSPSAEALDPAISKLIDQVFAAEKQFVNLETVLKKHRSTPGAPPQVRTRRGVKAVTFSGTHEDVVARTTVQGELFYSKTTITRKVGKVRPLHVERITIYDGKQTQTVEMGSSINIHDGKTMLVRTLSPHVWPLAIDVPFSDFLAGTVRAKDAAEPAFDSLLRDNVRAPTAAIEPRILGEEILKGLSCIRLEYKQEVAQSARDLWFECGWPRIDS